jgi:hypothetical protein
LTLVVTIVTNVKIWRHTPNGTNSINCHGIWCVRENGEIVCSRSDDGDFDDYSFVFCLCCVNDFLLMKNDLGHVEFSIGIFSD